MPPDPLLAIVKTNPVCEPHIPLSVFVEPDAGRIFILIANNSEVRKATPNSNTTSIDMARLIMSILST